jgi:hypothetical protein
LGNYPLKPWINKKDNPGQLQMRKQDVDKQSFFLPPRIKDDLIVVKFSQTEPKYELTPQVKNSKLIERSWMDVK